MLKYSKTATKFIPDRMYKFFDIINFQDIFLNLISKSQIISFWAETRKNVLLHWKHFTPSFMPHWNYPSVLWSPLFLFLFLSLSPLSLSLSLSSYAIALSVQKTPLNLSLKAIYTKRYLFLYSLNISHFFNKTEVNYGYTLTRYGKDAYLLWWIGL